MMSRYINFADRLSAWFGKAFAWSIIVMAFGVGYEVVVRRIFNAPTSWAFDITYIMYGTMFMMAGAYTLSRDGHVRGDFVYRLWSQRTQGYIELVLYILFFFPGITALILAGWKYAARSIGYAEVSVYSPAGIPIFQFKIIIVAAGTLLFIQGIAQVMRCIQCIQTGEWSRLTDDVEEIETQMMRGDVVDILAHGTEAIDIVLPQDEQDKDK